MMTHNKNNMLTDDELVILTGIQKISKDACLYIRNEHLCGFRAFNP